LRRNTAQEGAIMLKLLHFKINRVVLALGTVSTCAALAGCKGPASHAPASEEDRTAAVARAADPGAAPAKATPPADDSPSMVLKEGNTIKINFPGAPTLDNTVSIRQDGKINLALVGELKAAGLTPHELELELLKAYDSQLVVKQVTVTVETAVFEIYVTGAVMRPGKLIADHVETPLEAVIEAGVDNNRGNLKKVVVIREENGKTQRFPLDLEKVLKGKGDEPFTLKSKDKIFVPEKFMWY
jgi:polysaccharide export outer membrane protein